MPYYCTVPRCTSMAGKAKNVSFHQFPRDEELAKLWNRILKRGKPYTKYSKVCSLHFKAEDYTITSVGKNKGQWRTLRKDAIPSQNLPSESPAPYTRRPSGCWLPSQPNITDPLVQQQMAQAIYMQTMLAMQAAGASEPIVSGEPPPQTPETKPSPSGSSLSEIELLLRRDTDTHKEDTYKCHECSKCFKDPDVFLLHKRTHKNDTTINIEKENYSANIQDRDETLRANPILANLLKTSMRLEPESNMANILTVENQIMAALASNMEAYIRTLSSMLASQPNPVETEDNGDRANDGSDYEDETNDDQNDDSNDATKVKCEANDMNKEDDMFVDTNDQDTPMDEDDEHNDTNEDENEEIVRNSFSIPVASGDRIETPTNENVCTSEVRSIDSSTKNDETSEARNNIFIDENSNPREEIHHVSDDTNKTDSAKELHEALHENDENYECARYNEIRNEIENEVYIEKGNSIDGKHTYTDGDKNADGTSRKEAKNDTLVDVSDATIDEIVDGNDCKLVQGNPACDSDVETVEIVKLDV